MDTTLIVVLIVVLIVAFAAVVAVVGYRRRRSARLRETFGAEYERTIRESDDRQAAEGELREREKRRAGFEVTPLDSALSARYREQWAGIQQRFVDQPAEAVQQADRLVVLIMRESGYPVDDFDHRVDDISVDHPDVAQHYREAHAVAVAEINGSADTEQLRQAVTSYRQLVDALLRDSESRDAAQS